MPVAPTPARVPLSTVAAALREGAQVLRANFAISVGYAAIFAMIGLAAALVLGARMAPLLVSLAGGFMLVGPALLAGYFRVARVHRAGETARWADLAAGFREAPRELWVLSLVCTLLLLIWLTDAGILYSFMVGGEPVSLLALPFGEAAVQRVGDYLGWSALMGAGLAAITFAVSAFSVPLLCARRAGLVGAVNASVRAVFRNFAVVMLWGLLLATLTIAGILLLPLFVLAFPLLAYASDALYRRVFPDPAD